jgi:hypothetical protein
LPGTLLLLLFLLSKSVSKSSHSAPRERMPVRKTGEKENMSKSYVIEVGDDQAGLVIREDGEREYLFHAALDAYSALDGRRFANAFLAERAAIAHAASRRRRRNAGAEFLAR